MCSLDNDKGCPQYQQSNIESHEIVQVGKLCDVVYLPVESLVLCDMSSVGLQPSVHFLFVFPLFFDVP